MSDDQNYRTTKKDFEIFKKECQKWQEFFGLINYKIYYVHNDEDYDYLGKCMVNIDGMIATIILGYSWPDKPNVHSIKITAFHEICELFLGRIGTLANSRFVSSSEIRESIHEVIRVLEHKVFYK